jgi:hypothetical protein
MLSYPQKERRKLTDCRQKLMAVGILRERLNALTEKDASSSSSGL